MATLSPVALTGAAFVGLGLLWSWAAADTTPTAHGVLAFQRGARLNARQQAFVTRLRAATPVWVPITVTSGMRTYMGQAGAMMDIVEDGGDLDDLYPTEVKERLMSLPCDEDVWTAEVEQLYAERLLNPEGHVGDGSVDIHIRTLSEPQIVALENAVRRVGGTPLREKMPILLHVDLPRAA